MNIFSILGVLVAAAVIFASLWISSGNVAIYWDLPSLFIVGGGTLGAMAISIQFNRFASMLKVCFKRWIFGKKENYKLTIKQMMSLSEGYRKGESFSALKQKTKDIFLIDGLTMLEDGVLTQDEVLEILEERNELSMERTLDEAAKIKSIAKYPPSFAAMGTAIGMLVLLGNLGGEDAMKSIGPSMAICLITTIYGAVLANMVFNPIGENITDVTKEEYLKNQIIIEGVRLLISKSNPIVVAERLNSYVNPEERVNWKEMTGK